MDDLHSRKFLRDERLHILPLLFRRVRHPKRPRVMPPSYHRKVEELQRYSIYDSMIFAVSVNQ